ncbi:MAG: Lipoprotein signal peptidase [Brockia lithotrophica]|uniref:Lipoprotein signal peptidase n=1 Tax=Brockia lithotrophica TaxID=933949 RepID=A0A2T5G8E2_9BACL|nr:signal peptidase II [Brockia lithotrophica]PTQ52443.1 MAG: Lipoprotein signal peptidase [Brockia lithotrophica]
MGLRERRFVSSRWGTVLSRTVGGYSVAATVFLLDRAAKVWVLQSLIVGESVPIFDGILHITSVRNTGASFGMFRGATEFLTLLSAVAVVLLAFLVYRLSAWGWGYSLSLGLVLGGAAGNLWDRVAYGAVVDFIDVRAIHYPVFNVADAALTVGGVLLAALFLFGKKGRELWKGEW